MRFEVFERRQGYIVVGVLQATDDDGNQWEKVFPSVQTAEVLKRRFSTGAHLDMSTWTPLKKLRAAPKARPASTPKRAAPIETPEPQIKRARGVVREKRAPVLSSRPTLTEGWLVWVDSVVEFTPGLVSTYSLYALLDDIPEVEGDLADITPWLFDLHAFVHGTRGQHLAPSLYSCVLYGYIDPDEIEPVKPSEALSSSSDSAISAYIRRRLAKSPKAELDLSVSLKEPGRDSREGVASLYYLVDNEPKTVIKLLAQTLQRDLDELRDVVLYGRTRVDSKKRQPIPEDQRAALLEVIDDIGAVSVHADDLPIHEKRLQIRSWLSRSGGKTTDDDDDDYDDAGDDGDYGDYE